MNPLMLASLGVGLVGSIGKMFGRGRANRDLNQVLSQDPSYQINPVAKSRLGLATQLLNARMPGASDIERNIYTTQANTIANLGRNATDSSQALALATQSQGQSNQAFNQLGIQEAQDYQRRYQNEVGAQEGMIQEGDKQYQDQLRRFQDLAQIRSIQNANRQANWGDVSNLGFGMADFGLSGGFNNLFGGNGQMRTKSNNMVGGYSRIMPDINYPTTNPDWNIGQ